MNNERIAPRPTEKAEWLKPEVRVMHAGDAEISAASVADGPAPNFS